MNAERPVAWLLAAAALLASAAAGADGTAAPAESLASPASFMHVLDTRARSVALFVELGKVLTSPRCVNCHPAGDRPRQREAGRLHQPPVFRGADGFGLESMRCQTCHRASNFEPARVPGHPAWHLAPRAMAWEGKTLGEICRQIRDPARNGGRNLSELVEHIGEDTLVGWAWTPGGGRLPSPGTQREAGALAETWRASGAGCPD